MMITAIKSCNFDPRNELLSNENSGAVQEQFIGDITMTQPSLTSAYNLTELAEVNRLLMYIQNRAIDSEGSPVRVDEVPIVTNLVIQQLIWRYPYLDQILQELLDNLRFQK
jgi:hypothetical protein